MASCRRQGLHPLDYLRDVLTRLPGAKMSDIEKFLPAGWAKTNRSKVG